MKKILSLLLCACLLAAVFAIPISADEFSIEGLWAENLPFAELPLDEPVEFMHTRVFSFTAQRSWHYRFAFDARDFHLLILCPQWEIVAARVSRYWQSLDIFLNAGPYYVVLSPLNNVEINHMTVSIAPLNINFPAHERALTVTRHGGDFYISLRAPGEWSLELINHVWSDHPEWVSFSTMYGYGDTEVIIRFAPNHSYALAGHIDFTSDCGETLRLQIRQYTGLTHLRFRNWWQTTFPFFAADPVGWQWIPFLLLVPIIAPIQWVLHRLYIRNLNRQ